MVSILELERAQQRTLACGARPDVRADFASIIAELRDQDRDPFCATAMLLVGPHPASWATWHERPLERAMLMVSGSHPRIEFEVELLPGLVSAEAWHAKRSRCDRQRL
ncbi:MAG: hypothetical protein FJ035_04815 [Chloroflexi bacterium]|nr:hypothetical protein [Chloroflexota bacterium]